MKFDIKMKDADTSEDIEISMSDMFRNLELHYKYNSFPTAKLSFAVTDLAWFTRSNLELKLIFETYESKINLGIDHTSYDGNQVIVEGLMTHRKHSTIRSSRYLGNNAPDAIKSLGFDDKSYKFIDIEKNNIDYWQFNETDISSLEKILLGNKQYSLYYITESKIGIRDLNKVYKEVSYTLPIGNLADMTYDSRYRVARKENGETINDLKLKSSNLKVTSVNNNTFELGVRDVLNAPMICDIKDNTVGNALTNWIPNLDLNLIVTTGYSEWLPINVGDIVRYEHDSLVNKNLIVLELIKSYVQQNPYTAVKLGVLKEY